MMELEFPISSWKRGTTMATIPSARKLENSIFSQKPEYTPGSVGFAYATRRVRRERRVSQNPEVCGSGAPTRDRPTSNHLSFETNLAFVVQTDLKIRNFYWLNSSFHEKYRK